MFQDVLWAAASKYLNLSLPKFKKSLLRVKVLVFLKKVNDNVTYIRTCTGAELTV